MPEIDECNADDAVVMACIQELDEFVTRKLRRYPIDAVAVAAGSFLAGLLGALFDERELTADEIRDLLRELESDILDPECEAASVFQLFDPVPYRPPYGARCSW